MKNQVIFITVGIVLVLSLFFLGKTYQPPKTIPKNATSTAKTPSFNITEYLNNAKKKLSIGQLTYINDIESSVKRGDVKQQQIKANTALSSFWKDSIQDYTAYIYYLSETSKLDNSEKSLTFAARLILDNLRVEHDDAKLNWQAGTAISLFENLLQQNPSNEDAKIGLGACYIYGKGRDANPTETMKGIQQVLEVVRKDSTNMKAQLVLGVGGFFSGQYDKAVPRLLKVATAQPQNFEAVTTLADCYANLADKENAIKWYNQAKKINPNPAFIKAVDDRIKELSR